jgi:hypothetical protein
MLGKEKNIIYLLAHRVERWASLAYKEKAQGKRIIPNMKKAQSYQIATDRGKSTPQN